MWRRKRFELFLEVFNDIINNGKNRSERTTLKKIRLEIIRNVAFNRKICLNEVSYFSVAK